MNFLRAIVFERLEANTHTHTIQTKAKQQRKHQFNAGAKNAMQARYAKWNIKGLITIDERHVICMCNDLKR